MPMIASETIKVFVMMLASGIAVGFAVVATLVHGPPAQVDTPPDSSAPAAPAKAGGTSAASSPTTVAGRAVESAPPETFHEERYLVRAGDTLWDIAARHYQNPPEAMRRIKKRNGLKRDSVLAGEILVLPAAGRRSADTSAETDESGPADETAATEDAPLAP